MLDTIGISEINMIAAQKSLFISAFKYFILPVIGAVIAGLVLQFFLGRKNFKDFVAGLKVEIDSKIDTKEFGASIKRVHDERENGDAKIHHRLDNHIFDYNKVVKEISESLQWIKGYLGTNGKT